MDVSLEFGPSFTMATAHLKPGDSIKVEPGAMVSQSMGLEMKTGMSGKGGGLGGFLKSMAKSVFGGESFFLNTFTAGSGGGLDLNGAIISRRHQNPRDRIWVKHIYARWSVFGLISKRKL